MVLAHTAAAALLSASGARALAAEPAQPMGLALHPAVQVLVLALLLAMALALGAWAGWQRGGAALRDARRQARLAAKLTGGTAWRADAQHRLEPGGLGPAGSMPWAPFESDPRHALLRRALESRAAVETLVLTRGDDQSAWLVSAVPLFDSQGRFEGHQGLARPMADDSPGTQAVALLAATHPARMLLLWRPDAQTAWRVLSASPAARQALGDPVQVDDAQVQALLPASLQPAWQAGEPSADADGWLWRRHSSVTDTTLAVLYELPSGADPAASETASLTYTVSHDLRAPIRVVEGFTRIVKEDYAAQLDRVATDHLDRVLGAAARMNQMIDAMLTLARLSSQPLARQPVNLSQLASYVIDELRRASPERQAEIEIEPDLAVHGDPTLLRLVLENLLGNAWKYSARRQQAHIVFSRETVDGRPAYVVRDNGAGFDMRSAERLFGLFQRLHSASDFPGTGVGLASVRRIVQRHGGDIWADAEPGRGAAFHFTLRD